MYRRRSTTSTTVLIGATVTLTTTVATIFAATNAFAPDTAATPIRVRDQRRDRQDQLVEIAEITIQRDRATATGSSTPRTLLPEPTRGQRRTRVLELMPQVVGRSSGTGRLPVDSWAAMRGCFPQATHVRARLTRSEYDPGDVTDPLMSASNDSEPARG